ncbi:MAG: alpha-amylase family glycosyl hydrolase [Lachnospiraceae bacterium]
MRVLAKTTKTIAAFLICCILLCGCGHAPQVDTIDDNYRVFYEIFVGSFSDSDGDGIGDLRGIINRMDYLNDGDTLSGESLGIQGIWLSPIYSSPSYHKYDATNYYKIDEDFGTEEDLKELIALCHERNVKVILDLPINHTSTANLWFSKFANAHKAGDTADLYYDYYTWVKLSDRKGGTAYTKIPGCSTEFYECNFSTDMPELNFDNEAVREEVLNVAKYYLDLGVDGFRFDAVKYIYYSDTPQSADFWKWYMSELKAYKEDIYCVGECWANDAETLEYIEALNCFNFQMAQSEGFIANAAKGVDIKIFTGYVESYLNKVTEANQDGMIIPFISNHDMDRCAGNLTLATKRMQMAANLYILCSGSPFIYYGEEIGMKGTRGSANTDANRRLAMLWGDEDTVKNPKGATYEASKQTNGTVAEQQKDKDSLYNYYCRLIAVRNKYPEIARGTYKSLEFDSTRFGGFLITYNGEQTVLLHNTSDKEITMDLATCKEFPEGILKVSDFIGQGSASLKGTTITIGPQTSAILK